MKINKVPIIRDGKTRYELHRFPVNLLRIPLVLILNLFPRNLAQKVFLAFSNSNSDTRIVFENIATYKALEVMYTFPTRRTKRETSLIDDFWENFLSNALAVRNRLRLVKQLLTEAIEEKIKEGKNEIKVLSLGSGSARAVIESIAPLNGKIKLNAGLIDFSRAAIDFSKKLAQEYGLGNVIRYYRDNIQNLEKYYHDSEVDIVEMVGLLDYYHHIYAVDLISKVYKVLSAGGTLITCNISPNFEAPFVTKGINWVVIYRTPEELTTLLTQGGFSPENIKIILEPLKIHAVAICRKPIV